jgi:hypothetical protein
VTSVSRNVRTTFASASFNSYLATDLESAANAKAIETMRDFVEHSDKLQLIISRYEAMLDASLALNMKVDTMSVWKSVGESRI